MRAPGKILFSTIVGAIAIATAISAFRLEDTSDLSSYVRFHVWRSYYTKKVEKIPRGSEPRLMRFDWGGLITNPTDLVFDESDELLKPAGEQSAAWRARAGRRLSAEIEFCPFSARQISGHFYRLDFSC
jgi:hypothetical protein